LAFAVRGQKFSGAVYLPAIKTGSSCLGDPGLGVPAGLLVRQEMMCFGTIARVKAIKKRIKVE
jgi:hypothetical protein